MIPLDRVRAMLATATPSPIDVHRCDADGGDIDYQLQRGAGHGGTVLGYASDRDGSPRAKADATLWSHAPDLARDVLTLAAALTTAREEHDAARAEAAGLRAVVEGRTVPPTPQEIDHHWRMGGAWLVGRSVVTDRAEALRLASVGVAGVVWVALDGMLRGGCPCPWPTVAAEAATGAALAGEGR